MSDSSFRFKNLFLPYLILNASFIGLFTFFHWLLCIYLRWFTPTESMIIYGLPLITCQWPVLIFIMPRLRFLKLEPDSGRGNPTGFYFLLAIFGLCVPTIFAQKYLIVRTDRLTELQSVSQVAQKPLTRYYKMKDFYVCKKQATVYSTHFISGDHKENFGVEIYFACPAYASPKDTITNNLDLVKANIVVLKPIAWLGIKYQELVKNQGHESNDAEIDRFTDDVFLRFSTKDLQGFNYLERMDNSGLYQAYLAAINTSRNFQLNKALIFEARGESFEPGSRAGLYLLFCLISFLVTQGAWLVMVYKADLAEEYRT